MYQSSNSQYLNFYGPPHTISTIPYYAIVSNKEKKQPEKWYWCKRKQCLLGHSPLSQQEQIRKVLQRFSHSLMAWMSAVLKSLQQLLQTWWKINASSPSAQVHILPSLPLGCNNRYCLPVLHICNWSFNSDRAERPLSCGCRVSVQYSRFFGINSPSLFFQLPIAIFSAVVWSMSFCYRAKEYQGSFPTLFAWGYRRLVSKEHLDLGKVMNLFTESVYQPDAEQYTSLSETMATRGAWKIHEQILWDSLSNCEALWRDVSDVKETPFWRYG